MQTVRDLRKSVNDDTVSPIGFTANGWMSVLSHEMKVLFQGLCHVVSKYETKEEMNKALNEIRGLKGTFTELDKSLFKSEESYEGYQKHLQKHREFLERSGFTYPASREEAFELFMKWGLLLDKGEVWDIPVTPFPDVQDIFTLSDVEKVALHAIKLETLVHPIFSKLVLTLHESDEVVFHLSKAELKEMLQVNDALLLEVMIKLVPYLKDPIDNIQQIPDNEKMEINVVWERIYEDFLGNKDPQAVQ
ncbi:DUF6042 family protein [Brevibacillus sp. SYSU BS000544]|uniref:DUF6042 family protein n=1 Tax=Brevibacillus sp. SYSU BS000544 TaxID=3416443 RepID=UPI003CE4AC76